ncbi:MAG: MCE family protein [Bacteroidetes bacterium]|nr:MCE family protein [Bacteroidota bacterium]
MLSCYVRPFPAHSSGDRFDYPEGLAVKDQQKNEIKVGLTVLIGVSLLLYGFATFKDWSVGADEYLLRMHFPTSAGLAVGDQVTVNGVRAGKVETVSLLNGGVEVYALIDADVEVRRDARPVIQMLELMGGKKIEIRQGSEGPTLAQGEILAGTVDPDIAGALGLLGDMQGNVRDIGTQADSLLRGINAVVGDKEFIAALKQSVVNLHAVSAELRSYVSRNSGNLDLLTRNMVALSSRVDTMLTELRPLASNSLKKTDRVLGNADSLVTELRGIAGEIRDSRGLLHTVLHDTSFVRRLDNMLLKVDTLSRIIIDGEFKVDVSLF